MDDRLIIRGAEGYDEAASRASSTLVGPSAIRLRCWSPNPRTMSSRVFD
jgi:hypothetical protein